MLVEGSKLAEREDGLQKLIHLKNSRRMNLWFRKWKVLPALMISGNQRIPRDFKYLARTADRKGMSLTFEHLTFEVPHVLYV